MGERITVQSEMGKGFPFPEHVPLGYATKEYQSVSMQQVDDTVCIHGRGTKLV